MSSWNYILQQVAAGAPLSVAEIEERIFDLAASGYHPGGIRLEIVLTVAPQRWFDRAIARLERMDFVCTIRDWQRLRMA